MSLHQDCIPKEQIMSTNFTDALELSAPITWTEIAYSSFCKIALPPLVSLQFYRKIQTLSGRFLIFLLDLCVRLGYVLEYREIEDEGCAIFANLTARESTDHTKEDLTDE